ncbi:MAG: C39 family peptidase [Candidatus Kaiserbacteria bacterium]|nr:C39 family peptidase [Candidatus Kaiserbacteria bacterium]
MLYKILLITLLVSTAGGVLYVSKTAQSSFMVKPLPVSIPENSEAPLPLVDSTSLVSSPVPIEETTPEINRNEVSEKAKSKRTVKKDDDASTVFTVPFFSQFTDITDPEWKKIGCGIASLAMLIEFYEPGEVSVDTLLEEGVSANAYLSNAGWTYAGLIGISKKYGLGGTSYDMGGTGMETAFAKLEKALKDGPVMVSVHYTFDPKNPIPHLVIANGIENNTLYYNDPAEKSGGGSISVEVFKQAWKKRYIEIRPTT